MRMQYPFTAILGQDEMNANHLREIGEAKGVRAHLIDGPAMLGREWLSGVGEQVDGTIKEAKFDGHCTLCVADQIAEHLQHPHAIANRVSQTARPSHLRSVIGDRRGSRSSLPAQQIRAAHAPPARPWFVNIVGASRDSHTQCAGGEPQAIFQRLKDVASNTSLDFQTSFTSISKTRPERGSVHFQIKRPNLFRIDGTAGRAKYVLISDGKMMTIYNPGEQRYTEVSAPASAAEGMALLTGLSTTQSQVLALVRVIADVASDAAGTKVASSGADTVGSRQCKHFRVVQNADSWWPERWDVWLEDRDMQVQGNDL